MIASRSQTRQFTPADSASFNLVMYTVQICILLDNTIDRLDYQPLFGKGALTRIISRERQKWTL